MKKALSLMMALLLMGTYSAFALGSTESETDDQGSGTKTTEKQQETNLGEYLVKIDSCRLAKDFEGKDVVIIKYNFTNNSDNPTAFFTAFDDTAFQDGVGLNESYVLDESANYSSDNQTKEIKKGKSIDVEVAYELNDNETDVTVEVSELISFNDSVVTKTFKITD